MDIKIALTPQEDILTLSQLHHPPGEGSLTGESPDFQDTQNNFPADLYLMRPGR